MPSTAKVQANGNDNEITSLGVVDVSLKGKARDKPKVQQQNVTISAPNMQVAQFDIVGTAPLVINRFSSKDINAMRATQEAGTQSNSKKKRDPKDFDARFQAARYISEEGWDGIHAAAFRLAMIGACRLVSFKMTLAKLSVFIVEDGRDTTDATPLVRIYSDAPPIMDVRPARNANGSFDLRVRPLWKDWSCKVKVRFDLDQFSLTDITNLLSRVGTQCGIGEGRPSSKMSAGIGWGVFDVAEQ
jgi:hypothetical protein